MAEQIAYAEWACIDQYDISGQVANFGSERMVDLQECVTFPDPTVTSPSALVYKKRLAGAESAKLSISGYLDTSLTGNLAAFNAAFSASPIISKGDARTLGSGVLMFVGKEGTFSQGGPVGQIIPVSAEISNDGAVTYGALYEFGTKSATGNGTSRTVAAVTTGKRRYLHAHVLSVSGTSTPTMALIYETSAIGDYSDAVTRHTFTNFTAAGVQRAIKTATVSDTHGRFKWTLSGTSPVFVVRFCEGVR